MTHQHAFLRDLYNVSMPKIDKLFLSALESGVYGAKLSGSGRVGCIVALVKNEQRGARVVDACLSAGTKTGWVSGIGEGERAEKS